MKYWFYSEGNILGPYEPAEMLALPAFAEESLVCPETATGDNPGDWRPALQVAEIASAMSVGAGRQVTAGVMAGAYEYETGFSATARYFEDKEPQPGASYGELLDTIDNILGAYKEGQEAPKPAAETDYDLAEKFDIRLSRIQEELEAARWEKNLLLEKMRMKEMEEKKNRERINELEARLKGETGKSEVSARETEQVRHLAELNEKAETIKKIEEIKREERSLREDIARDTAAPAAAQPGETAPAQDNRSLFEPEVKKLKSIPRGSEIKLEKNVAAEPQDAADDAAITSRKLKSLGQTQEPAYVYGSHYDKPLPGPEAAPEGAFKPETFEPLPQQAGGVVYDFTVVTSKAPETSQQFHIETRQDIPVQQAQPAQQFQAQPAPQFQAQPAPQFQAQQFQPQPAQQAPAQTPQAGRTPFYDLGLGSQNAQAAQAPSQFRPAAAAPLSQPEVRSAAPAAAPEAEKAAPDSPDKTQRIPTPQVKSKPEAAKGPEKPKKKGGKMAFITILVLFGSIATGGLGYFFMGEGLSFSEFSMMNMGGKKKTSAMTSQVEAKGQDALQTEAQQPAAQAQPAVAQPAASPEKPVNENISRSLEIVKGYKLSGGRGTIASWFANSFLSGASGGTNEEWTATPLHGDILVVQYRLTRAKQEPMVYQFEVDAAKQDIVRGINNNAIELLDSSAKEKTVSAAPVKKARPAPKKSSRPKTIPILPLPDEPAVNAGTEQDPTGFEQPENDDKVKYLKAQESDEELF